MSVDPHFLADLSFSETCDFLTTIITGITALVVAWYTRITAQLHKAARDQVTVAQQQLAEAKAQNERAKVELDRRLLIERLNAQPLIEWVRISETPEREHTIYFRLQRGLIWSPVVRHQNTAITGYDAVISPNSAIRPEDTECYLCFHQRPEITFPYRFTVEGISVIGETISITYEVEQRFRYPRLVV
jgi:hypothetical protein